MSTSAVVENGCSPVWFLLAACGSAFILFSYMSRNSFIQSNKYILIRLALELSLLAFVCFIAAVGVLYIFHLRFEQQGQQLSEQGAVGRKLTGPLDFTTITEG